LLSLLQKIGVENILIVVFIWHQRMPGHFSNEVYKMVLDRGKDLLTTLHLKVLEAEKMIEERIGNAISNISPEILTLPSTIDKSGTAD